MANGKDNNGGESLRVVVLVDRDDDDCEQLKAELERMAVAAGLSTKSSIVQPLFCKFPDRWS